MEPMCCCKSEIRCASMRKVEVEEERFWRIGDGGKIDVFVLEINSNSG